MRPLRIEVEGFSTFRDPTVVDLQGHDLVAFTGQTGSGKSSLIDALTFALYGSVARYGRENVVAPAIHQMVAEAKVRLDFEVAGKRYAAVRVLRRRTQKDASAAPSATTREARLESLDTGEVLAGNVRELNAAVIELLGLDFTQFTRTIVLPQGDFADFLNDEPANRQKLLRRLLDMELYVKMGKQARVEAKRAEQQVSTLAAEQQRNPAPTDDEIGALKAKQVALLSAQPLIEAALAEVGVLVVQRQQLLDQHKEAKHTVGRLSGVQVPEAIASAGQKLGELAKGRVEAGTLLESARTKLETLSGEEPEDLSDLGLVIDRLERLASLKVDDEKTSNNEIELAATLKQFDDQEAELVDRRDTTQSTVERAQASANASSWVAALAVGKPCPVCQQTVGTIPDHDPDSELETAKAESADASNAQRAWERERSQANAELNAFRRTADQHTAARADLESQLSDSSFALAGTAELSAAALSERADQLTEKRDAAQVTAKALKVARTEFDKAQAQVAKADSRVGEVESEIKAESLKFNATRDTLADLEPPPVNGDSVVANWSTLATWASGKISHFENQAAQVVEQGHKVSEELNGKETKLTGQAERLGLPSTKEGLPRLLDAVLVATTKSQSAIDEADRRRKEAKDRQQRITAIRKAGELNKSLGGHLDAAGFEGWLLNEALDNIVGKATDRLLQLSGGQYSLLVNDRQFAIIDHNNADERRDVRTLSGGETFLASLALALALADSIAELAPVDAPRLESMFLDEGFGTLDPETLDVVASAIEDLAADGRMIGIVTHVRDLAERMPVRFEVSKGPTTSTVQLVEL